MRLADLQADRGDLNSAVSLYEHVLSQQSNKADAALGLARVYSEKNENEKALPLLQQVLTADPANVLAHFRLSALYRKMNKPDDAKRELAEYQKYKEMKEKLHDIYHDMRVKPAKQEGDETEVRK